MSSARQPYQYVVLRCVPRPDREEFVNVGVVLYCQASDYLATRGAVDHDRLHSFAPGLEIARVEEALAFVDRVCRGTGSAGLDASPYAAEGAAGQPIGTRFGFVKAPRSTVVQPGPVHGGLTDDPAAELERLFACYVA